MAKPDDEFKAWMAPGCISAIISIFVTIPIWYVLLASILFAIDAKPWQWTLFIIYVPAGLIGSVAGKAARHWARQEHVDV